MSISTSCFVDYFTDKGLCLTNEILNTKVSYAKETSSRLYEKVFPNTFDIAGVRQFKDGKLINLHNDKIASLKVKPILDMLPFRKLGGEALLVNLFGNNMRITFDPFWDHSQIGYYMTREFGREFATNKIQTEGYDYSPKQLLDYVQSKEIKIIVMTGGEPSVNADYILYVSELAFKVGIDIVLVTNGLVSSEFIKKMPDNVSYIVNLYSTNREFYLKHCKANLQLVYEGISEIVTADKLVAFSTIFIPEINDAQAEIEGLAVNLLEFTKANKVLPRLIIKKFLPTYRVLDRPKNTELQLKKYKEILSKNGIEVFITE